MAENGVLIGGVTGISVDPEMGELPKGDVLIEGRKIVAVLPQIEAPDAEVISSRATTWSHKPASRSAAVGSPSRTPPRPEGLAKRRREQ